MSTQGIRAGRAYVEIGANDQKLDQVLAQDENKLRKFASSVAGISGVVLAVGAAAAASLAPAISKGSEFEQTLNKFDTIFGDLSEANKEWSRNLAREFGRSRQQIHSFMADTQTLLLPIGFEPGAAEQMSRQLTTLASDMGSFHNKADADVMVDFHAALTGSGEVMKKYGVIVSEASVKQELLNNGMDPTKAGELEKVWARYQIILRGTTSAQGDTIRSMDSFDNQMKSFTASVDDLQVSIGMNLLPILTPLVKEISKTVQQTGQWIEENGELIQSLITIGSTLTELAMTLLPVFMPLLTLIGDSIKTTAKWIEQNEELVQSALSIAESYATATAAVFGVKTALQVSNQELTKAEAGLKKTADAQKALIKIPPPQPQAVKSNLPELLEKSLTPAMKLQRELEQLSKAWESLGNDTKRDPLFVSAFQRLSEAAYDSATGIKSAMTKAREEIALLKGTITESELELQKMAANGAPQRLLAQYRSLMEERTRLQQAQDAREERQKADQQRRESVLADARNDAGRIVDDTRTDDERRAAELQRLRQLRFTIDPTTGKSFLDNDTYQRAVQKLQDDSKPDPQKLQDRMQQATASDIRSDSGARALLAAFGGNSGQQQLLKSSQQTASEAAKQTQYLAKIERKTTPPTVERI